MADITDNNSALTVKLVGASSDGTEQVPIANQHDAIKMVIQGRDGLNQADVIFQNGQYRMATSGLVQIEELFGQDPIPDTWFTVKNAGQTGDTFRIQIAATTADPTSPDADVPAVDITYTVTALTAGNEIAVANAIASALNANSNFINAELKADVFNQKLPVIHITSKIRSLTGDFYERPNPGDFMVTTTGTAQVLVAYQDIKSRGKGTSLDRDPNDPRIGILGISGSVRVRADQVDNLYFKDALNAGSPELKVNGSVTPVIFTINANPAGGKNIYINQLKLHGVDTNIKVQTGNFLGLNTALTNGIEIKVYQAGSSFTLPLIKTTRDLLARFATSAEDNKIISQSGGDFIQSVFDLDKKNVSIFLEPGTTDRIEVKIQDNISAIVSLIFTAEGFEEEP